MPSSDVGQDLAVGGDDAEVRRRVRESVQERRRPSAAPAAAPARRAAMRQRLDRASARACWPRPRGRSGCVTTPTTVWRERLEERLERRAPRTPACRRTRCAAPTRLASPFAGALQLPDLADDQVALDAAQPIDEQRAVEVIHLVLERAREQARALDRLLVAVRDRVPCTTARAGRATVALKPGTLRQPSSSSCMPSRSTNSG